jgi:hypothetical protein
LHEERIKTDDEKIDAEVRGVPQRVAEEKRFALWAACRPIHKTVFTLCPPRDSARLCVNPLPLFYALQEPEIKHEERIKTDDEKIDAEVRGVPQRVAEEKRFAL